MSQEAVPVEPHETLYLPMRRRSTSEYVTTPEGTRELHIFFGIKEITIDEPDLLSFGETLLQQEQFRAGSATAWSSGEPYPWERVRELLETLLAEETRMGMWVGVAVGWQLAKELADFDLQGD